MPVSAIPFAMPAALEIPAHFAEDLRRRPREEAVVRGMELLLEFELAETVVYEQVDGGGLLVLGGVVSRSASRARELRDLLSREACYGQSLSEAGGSLAGQAFARDSSLLVMGRIRAGEEGPLPAAVAGFLLAGRPETETGFLYVLRLTGREGRPLGALSLLRPPESGPLHHEQPHLAEAFRQLLGRVLEG